MIHRDCSGCCILYYQQDSSRGQMVKQYFSISSDLTSISYINSKPTLLTLPDYIQDQIFAPFTYPLDSCEACYNPVYPVYIDVYKKIWTVASPILSSVSRSLRSVWMPKFWCNNRLVVNISTTSRCTNFRQFKNLEKLWFIGEVVYQP
jgi:hypothetical protein